MLKHTISISCCFEVAVVAFFFVLVFCHAKPRKKLELDLTQVNKTDKASFSYFLAIYHQYFQRSRSLCDVSFTKPLFKFIARCYYIFHGFSLPLYQYCLQLFLIKQRQKAMIFIKIVILDVETTLRHKFLSSELQCLPRGDLRNLCASTRIRLLATHSIGSMPN